MFGEKLRELRKSRNISQEKLGEILNVTNKVIYDWENGRSQPSIEKIIEFSKYFDVSVDYLFGLTDEDITKIQELNRVAREAGLIQGEDITMEEFKKAMNIIKVLGDKGEK